VGNLVVEFLVGVLVGIDEGWLDGLDGSCDG
jgi:hypothetical protein